MLDKIAGAIIDHIPTAHRLPTVAGNKIDRQKNFERSEKY